MTNKWLDISLDDYENHMALPSIGQSRYLSTYIKEILEICEPKSIAIIGCSGGNGLENINSEKVKRVICIDINSKYLEKAKKRFKSSFRDIEFICADISSDECSFDPVELIFAGLLFEYVDNKLAINNISKLIKVNGRLVVVLQLPSSDISEVSPSPYKRMEILNDLFSFVSADNFIELSEAEGFTLISRNKTRLNSGKEFLEIVLQRKA
jgi:SAM-dependent methyltransferase